MILTRSLAPVTPTRPTNKPNGRPRNSCIGAYRSSSIRTREELLFNFMSEILYSFKLAGLSYNSPDQTLSEQGLISFVKAAGQEGIHTE